MFWRSWPRWARVILAIAIIILVIIVVALIISWAGGADWHIDLGRFHFDVNVTKGAA